MALPSRYGVDKKINSMEGLSAYENGGKGSGNFGHAGRPGEVGGSGKGTGGVSYDEGPKRISKETQDRLRENIDIDYRSVYDALDEVSGLKGGSEETEDRLREIEDRIRDIKSTLKEMREVELSTEESAYRVIDMAGEIDDNVREILDIAGDDFKYYNWRSLIENLEDYADGLEGFLLNGASNKVFNGGKGSGNFGHAGRPGEVGGSGDGHGSGIKTQKDYDEKLQRVHDLEDKIGSLEYDIDEGVRERESGERKIKELESEVKKLRKETERYEMEQRAGKKTSKGTELSLRGKSLYEKVHMIEAGDEVHITPKDNLPNFDRKIKVDYIQDGTIHYGSSETSDGYTYPAWAIKDITKIIRKKKNEVELNGGKGSGNFGHAGRPGEVGGSGKGGETYPGSNVPRAIMEGYLTSSSRYSDIDRMSIVITPKGNLQLLYDGKDVATIGGNKYLIQEASRLGMIKEDGSRLEGPAKTRDEYNYKTASEKCQDEASDVYASLCEHAEWIASDGSFAEGYNEDDYWKLADRLGTRGDKIGDKSNRYTQRDLVEGFKRTQKDVEPYGLLDGSLSNDKLDEFMSNYDFDKKNSYSGEMMMGMPTRYGVEKKINSMAGLSAYENGGKGSGNFGHAGRPGEVGGSSKDGLGSVGKYDVKDGKDAREYLTGGGKMQLISPEAFGFTYDAVGSPVRLSRFEKSADDKLWSAWASMQKVQDDKMIGDVTAEGLATAHDALWLAKAVISTSQTAYMPSERKSAEAQTQKFVDGVKDEVKKAKIKLTADTKKYGDTEVRKATRKALDDISSAMDGFLGYENPSREYKD